MVQHRPAAGNLHEHHLLWAAETVTRIVGNRAERLWYLESWPARSSPCQTIVLQ